MKAMTVSMGSCRPSTMPRANAKQAQINPNSTRMGLDLVTTPARAQKDRAASPVSARSIRAMAWAT